MNSNSMVVLREGQSKFFAEPPDFSAARDLFLRVVEHEPDWVEGYHWLATSYEALQEDGKAEEAYRAAVKCDPKDPRPQIALGRHLFDQGRISDAVRELEKGVKLKHHYAEADSRLFLAEAYEAAGERRKARQEWTRISQMESFYPSYEQPMDEARRRLKETD